VTTPEYDRMRFLAAGFLMRGRMSPDMLARGRSEFHSEVALRGGVVDERSYDLAIPSDLLREIVERAGRHYRDELIPRMRRHLTEDQVEALEIELSDALARTLD
jgi:hypothetical protein